MSNLFRLLPAVVLLSAALVAAWESFFFPPGPENVPGPGIMPLWIAALLAVVALYLLARQTCIISRFLQSPEKRADDQTVPGHRFHLLTLLSSLVVYASVMPLLGFITSTSLLFFSALRVFGYRGRLHAWSCSLAISFALYLLFCKFMNVPLPAGWLG